jgi:hypothetical protein
MGQSKMQYYPPPSQKKDQIWESGETVNKFQILQLNA